MLLVQMIVPINAGFRLGFIGFNDQIVPEQLWFTNFDDL